MEVPKQPIGMGNNKNEEEINAIVIEDGKPIERVFTPKELKKEKEVNGDKKKPWLWVENR